MFGGEEATVAQVKQVTTSASEAPVSQRTSSNSGTNDGIGTGAIVGIVIGSLLLVGGIVVSVVVINQRRDRHSERGIARTKSAQAGKRIAGIVRATPGTKPGITDVGL